MARLAGVVGPWGPLDERLRNLERREQRYRRGEDFRGKYEFKVAPTCPPSTSIHIRGGRAWCPTDSWYPGRGWTVPNLTIDLQDPDQTVWGYTWDWANADYYLGTVVTLNGGYNPDIVAASDPAISLFVTWPTGTERATAAEAEDDCIDILWDDANRPWDYNLPLCCLVFRNTGTLGTEQYMPIDAVNRGRSYFFQDARTRGQWVLGDI